MASIATAASPVESQEKAFTRLDKLVNLRTDRFPFYPPATRTEWDARSAAVRRQVKVAACQWPSPTRPTPRAVIHGRIVRDDYTVEKVYLESYPGHFVTGNLYRPRGVPGPHPGVLSPHGHWKEGRFHAWDDDELARQLASGAEKFPVSGRYPLQARCVQLARMGCVVFLYDMLGYADSQQLTQEAIHAPTEESILQASDQWGFYSVQAELRMQGPLAVQTYNSLCALDWLASLDDVDASRLAVTGGSSGATQTLMLCAVDDRPRVAFPVVMVSTAMQGGCACENACCLRIDSSNVEIASLMAPKPLGMASADDWTRNFANDGYPEMQQLYRLLGAEDRVTNASLTQYPHNYNHASRAAMYPWLARWLELDLQGAQLQEREFIPLSEEEMSVWNEDHPAPPGGSQHEVALMRAMDSQSAAELAGLTPRSQQTLEQYREVVGGALKVQLGGSVSSDIEVKAVSDAKSLHEGFSTQCYTIRELGDTGDLKATLLTPAKVEGAVLWLSPQGIGGLFTENGAPLNGVRKLLDNHIAVLGVDLLAQPQPEGFETPVVPGMKPVASLTYCYNRTLVAHRTADTLAALKALRELAPDAISFGLVGTRGTATYVAAALALAGDSIDAAALDTGGFRYHQLTSWRSPDFLPGAVKYGDLPGQLALLAPQPLLLAGEDLGTLGLTKAAYQSAEASDNLQVIPEDSSQEESVDRLLLLLLK